MLSSPAIAPQRRGATTYSNNSLPSGNTEIVSAAANVNGIIIRTAIMASASGALLQVRGGTNPILTTTVGPGNWREYLGNGILIPPGASLNVDTGAAGSTISMTYDLL